MSRKLRLGALLVSFCLLLGCAVPVAEEPEEPAAETAAEETERREEKPFGLAWEPDQTLNPYSCMVLSNRTVLSLLYEPLFAVNADFTATPYLCESLTSSGDGRTHTLTLRQGVTFSNGTALTAADAAASIRAAQNSDYYGSRLQDILSVQATGDLQLTITTGSACGTLPSLLNVYVVQAATTGDTIPVGTGPYRCDGTQLLQTDWWRETKPPVSEETIGLVAVDSAAEIRDQFERGDVTLACADPNSGAQLTYHTDYELWNNNTTVLQYVGFNLSSPVFAYTPVRTSVTHALNRDAIISNTALGFATAATLPASSRWDGYDQKLAAKYGYDEAAFEKILESSEIRDYDEDGVLEVYTESGTQPLKGTLLVCNTSEQRVAAAQMVADTLNSRGFDLTIKSLEYNEYVYALRTGNYDLYYGEVRLRPDFDLSGFFDASGSLSYGGMADGTLATLCDRAVENIGNVYELHLEIMSRGMLCPILCKTYAIYSARGRVTNLNPCLDGVFTLPYGE